MSLEPFIGGIYMFAGNFAPTGYALCNGQILQISQNAALFSILGNTYGGDGRTTFALPNLMGRVAIGAGHGAGLSPVVPGQQGGREMVTLTPTQMPAHTHAITVSTSPGDQTNPQNNLIAASAGASSGFKAPPGNATLSVAAVGTSGDSQPVNVQNPYLGVTYIIALQGIFPARS